MRPKLTVACVMAVVRLQRGKLGYDATRAHRLGIVVNANVWVRMFIMSQREKWHRVEEGKLIAGVCAGVAETYGTSADTVRTIYVIATLCGLPMVVVYLLQWAIYPRY